MEDHRVSHHIKGEGKDAGKKAATTKKPATKKK